MGDEADIKAKQQAIEGWLADYQKRTEQVPAVQQSLELTKYQLNVASSIPPELPNEIRVRILDAYSNTATFWKEFVSGCGGGSSVAHSGLALEASGSNVAYQAMAGVGQWPNQKVVVWATQHNAQYQEIQHRQLRDEAIEKLLARVRPKIIQEFKISCATFAAVISGSQPQSAWGIVARNVLEHLKGEFFETSQQRLKMRKVKWPDFAAALACNGSGSSEHIGLLKEEATHTKIHFELTQLAKNLCQFNESQLRDLRTELHDHLFTILSLVDETLL